MPAVKRQRARDIFSPEEIAELTRVSPWKGVALILHAWGVIAACLAAATLSPWAWPLLGAFIGGRLLGLAILAHEAAHGLLHPRRPVNNFLGQWACGGVVGLDLAAYRDYHLQHHKFTQQPEDPDRVLSAPFPVTRASLLRKILRDLTGQTFVKQQIAQIFAAFGRGGASGDQAAAARRGQAAFVLINGALTAGLGAFGLWSAVVVWWMAVAAWFPLFLRLRNIAEHACTSTGADPFSHARTTHANLAERAFVAPYWVNYHAEHHLFMYIPCYNLAAAHRILMEKGYASRMTLAPGYWSVLKRASSLA